MINIVKQTKNKRSNNNNSNIYIYSIHVRMLITGKGPLKEYFGKLIEDKRK